MQILKKIPGFFRSFSIEKIWKLMLIWFIFVMLLLAIAGEWSVVLFGVTCGLVFGGIAYRSRHKIKPFFTGLGLNNYWGFRLISIIVTVTEETYCYLMGNRIYSAIFVLPMQLMDFTGINNTKRKYPVSIFLPFILTVPAALGMYILFSVSGYPLD